ncbi:MAG: TIGR03617 family F420-dependent LLM class oxidoreductase [Pseudomonadales bacterium]|jgi:probable F420-dependent oxidoreductase|nr:TIGR03617 family F420-dependent LLM class oxidoreductase [Pseudomonadales bacterium]MCP5321620.1 TIGR03617 family F420-dependent LLM class oxidoreductase [Pseudomonadales bacterium]MCP5336533.1 TIGR03617 family F420-dependent LLM class oxidoreductase [Pseudomonadales bacterium]
MALRVETPLFGPDTNQYAGHGQPSVTLEQMAATCRLLEDIGFDGITTAEAGHDAFLPVMIAAANTSRLIIGTNVAVAFPRSPMVTAQMAWDLAHYSGGRFTLGLGTQVKGHNEKRYSTPWPSAPGPRMREYLLCLKAIFASFQNPAKPTYFKGEFYQFTLMAPFFNPGPIAHPEVPFYISAVGPYMARLAGELCEGLRLHPISTFSHTREVILPAIAEGAARSGRDPAKFDLVGAPFLATGRTEADVEQAKNAVRKQISFYASTRSYHRVLEYHGWEETGLRLHELSLAGKWADMPALITDEMLDEWAVVATYDRLGDAVRAKADGLFDTVTLTLLDEARRDEDLMRATIARLHTV